MVFYLMCCRIANNSGKKGSDADSDCEDTYSDASYVPDRKCGCMCSVLALTYAAQLASL